MSFWQQHMPKGMVLRSPWKASFLSDPDGRHTLDAYAAAIGAHIPEPVPLTRFVEYGRWFQSQAVPGVDPRYVSHVQTDASGFRLTLSDGDSVRARRVIVAGGISSFAARPRQFDSIAPPFASHSSEHTDLGRFAGQRVVVIGSGQSALESAALLHESGADVEVFVRQPIVSWTWSTPWLHTFRPVGVLLYAWPDVGPAFLSHLVARPKVFRSLPRDTQDRWHVRAIRPAGAWWLKPRLVDVPIHVGRSVTSAAVNARQVKLNFNDGTECKANHVLLATGYRVDINRYDFLDSELLRSIRQTNGYPHLDKGFQSSVPRLHFLGAPAAWSHGPLMRFVAGADFAARSVASRVVAARPARASEIQPAVSPGVEVGAD
jgi:cation diffusion facilitator CzcD-associated flavoprotein CzcO